MKSSCSVSQNIGNNNFRIFDLPKSPLFISADRKKYLVPETITCVKALKYHYCKLLQNIHKVINQTICEVGLVANSIANCEAHYFELTNDVYVSSTNGFHWFIAPATTNSFHISCFKDKFKLNDFQIFSNSILTVRSDCVVTNKISNFMPSRNINFTLIQSLNFSKHAEKIEIPPNVLPEIHLDRINIDSLKNQGIQLE